MSKLGTSVRLRIFSGVDSGSVPAAGEGMSTLFEGRGLWLHGSPPEHAWVAADGARCFVFGDIVGVRRNDGRIVDGALQALDPRRLEGTAGIDAIEGRFIFARVHADGATCEVWGDRFGSLDLYWQGSGNKTTMATSLEFLPIARNGGTASGIAYAHALTVYGTRPAKQDTLYADVRRLGVDQGARVSDGRLQILPRQFTPLPTAQYGEPEHHEYADALLEAIRARGSSQGNVVYLSSGWDSTAILACLVHLFGARRVRAVIGRMRYAERSGVINQFELDRARAVADFFGVRLDVCEFDYRTDAAATVAAARPLFRSQQVASVTGLNHWLLAQHVANSADGAEVVFAGEMSDGAHNLGFSQFVTIFHPVLEFREYADKMAAYLFGPTFLTLLQQGKHAEDPIWNLFRQRAGATAFEEPASDPAQRGAQLLSSFFLRGSRLPLTSLANSKFLNGAGLQQYQRHMTSTYLERAGREVTPATLYAWYLHLYNSFHWQGSTVVTLPLTAAAHGLRCALPYHDGRIQDFLAAMPESWGRGLDLRPTKYPLKWTLEHRVKYPMHLQVGPHSYLYDVDPTFSHSAELLFGSSLGEVFKSRLRANAHAAVLDDSLFDVAYVERIVARYLGGEEFRGAEMNDLMVLGLLAMVGRYGED